MSTPKLGFVLLLISLACVEAKAQGSPIVPSPGSMSVLTKVSKESGSGIWLTSF
ncbi:MAG: hypothetical protein QOF62_1310 [Pyrinomonadaceae bacterium]|jgi:hypothetical protein|nr:hypothetical protein [Pyrinomonadaceae bacterium]